MKFNDHDPCTILFVLISRFSMEIQLNHFNTAYGTLDEAVLHPDGVASIAILFKADKNNHEYKPLVVRRFMLLLLLLHVFSVLLLLWMLNIKYPPSCLICMNSNIS